MGPSLRVLAQPGFATAFRNPYQALLYGALSDLGVAVIEFDESTRPPMVDIVHVHWPEAHVNSNQPVRAVWRVRRRLRRYRQAKAGGARLVWTVHNLGAHTPNSAALERYLWRRFLPLVDGWIALSDISRTAAIKRWPELADKPCAVTPHGHFRAAYPNEVDRSVARAQFGFSDADRVVGFVGRIKEYKGVPELLDAFAATDSPNARLLIAGRVQSAALQKQIDAAANADRRIVFRPGDIDADDMQAFVRACELVVLPYADVLNSGSAILALSFDRPVLAPALGSLPELREQLGPWVGLYDGALTPAVLESALSETSTLHGTPNLAVLEWPGIAEATLALYRRVVDL